MLYVIYYIYLQIAEWYMQKLEEIYIPSPQNAITNK